MDFWFRGVNNETKNRSTSLQAVEWELGDIDTDELDDDELFDIVYDSAPKPLRYLIRDVVYTNRGMEVVLGAVYATSSIESAAYYGDGTIQVITGRHVADDYDGILIADREVLFESKNVEEIEAFVKTI